MARCSVDNDLKAVGPAVLWADDLAAAAGIADDARYAIQVCLEEALSNLILHATAPDGRKRITVDFVSEGGEARLIVCDSCVPFNVVGAVASLPAHHPRDQIGGNGLRLIRDFATAVSYRSSDGQNTLDMAFRRVG